MFNKTHFIFYSYLPTGNTYFLTAPTAIILKLIYKSIARV